MYSQDGSAEQDNTEQEVDDPNIGEPDTEEINPDKSEAEQDQQTNTESYGATAETNDQQIIEQSAQDKGLQITTVLSCRMCYLKHHIKCYCSFIYANEQFAH